MSLLFDAATAWNSLLNVKYSITVGRKGKSTVIDLSFSLGDFPHVAGMQYATDVDFGINRSEYYGENLISVLLDGTLNGALIENSRNWNCTIKSRLETIISIKDILEGDFIIAKFDKYILKPASKIEAKYVIKSSKSNDVFFVFLDKDSNHYYCKSAFHNSPRDYLLNQTRMTVLEVRKTENEHDYMIYKNPNYKSFALQV